MKTSIIIPTYNEADYLPKLLDSILLQTKLPDEIIICDNNSTDNTIVIARSYQSKLPIIVITEPQKGILPTVEAAWRHASSELICKTDADAILPPDWIKNITAHFAQDAKLMACTGPWFPADGGIIDKLITSIGGYIGSWAITAFRGHPLLLGPNSAFRRLVLVQVNGYTGDNGIDDQIITQKLHSHRAKTNWFADCLVYHSTRRFQHQPRQYILALLSLIHPRFYHEKNS